MITEKMNAELEHRWQNLVTEGMVTPGVVYERNPLSEPPEWYDAVKYKKAQVVAKKYFLSLNLAHFIGNILLIHLPQVLVPILATGRSSSVYMLFLRILSTTKHVFHWYADDPFDVNSKSHKSLMQVRHTCHMSVSRLMNEKYAQKHCLWMNQFDMAMTQWSLIGLVGIRPKQCGFHATSREEFEYYIYFWKVIGYCMGIEDRFNICFDDFHQSIAYFDICFKRCYKKHLDNPCDTVIMGMKLTEGVFLGINGVIPKFTFSFEGFMKYWYEALQVNNHPIKLDTVSAKMSYWFIVLTMDYMLRIPIFYSIISYLFFKLQALLFVKVKHVKEYTDKTYPDLIYQLRYIDDAYRVDNKYYKSNV